MACADETCVEKTVSPDKADQAEASMSDDIGEDFDCPDESSDNGSEPALPRASGGCYMLSCAGLSFFTVVCR